MIDIEIVIHVRNSIERSAWKGQVVYCTNAEMQRAFTRRNNNVATTIALLR